LLQLASAPFDKQDERLVPKAGSCVNCPKQTAKPQLVQISAAWNSREGAPLVRNQYVQLEIKKPKANGASTKLSANLEAACPPMGLRILAPSGFRSGAG
jgi:hypothetical protein